MVKNIVGTPARGADFFDREELVGLLWKRLETGNILLAAPRRFGKTSVMYRLLDRPEPGWKPIHVDAESIREPDGRRGIHLCLQGSLRLVAAVLRILKESQSWESYGFLSTTPVRALPGR
ncbi:MAG: hypothetical protein Q7U03_09945 [Syntrophales bacterium]|nr:hypothetical protein [Syntrophales bacterium]